MTITRCFKRTAIFSGRFDPPNLGHVITTLHLLGKYHVILVVLDNDEYRECIDADLAIDIFSTVFEYIDPKPVVISNLHHFQFIELVDLAKLVKDCGLEPKDTVYVGGNKEVNDHIKKLNYIDVEYVERIKLVKKDRLYLPADQYMFESTRIRNKIARGFPLADQYNLEY